MTRGWLLLLPIVVLGVVSGCAGESQAQGAPAAAPSHYVGLWVTADNQIRQRLLPDGRYVEARGTNETAYTGRYEITGDHIEYWDDSGFTADGDFRDDVLYHAGMVMHRSG